MIRAMRIALILPGFSANANDWAIPALQQLATRLAVEHELVVFSLRYPAGGHYQFNNLTLWATGGGQRFRLDSLAIWWRTLRAIIREHRRKAFDLFHAFWLDEPGLVAVLAGRWLHRPVIASSAGGELVYLPDIGYGTQGSRFRRGIIRHTLSHAQLVTGGSRYQLGLCRQQGVAENRLRLAPLGLDCDWFRPEPAPPLLPPTLIQAAALTPIKNQALLLTIFSQIRQTISNARLLLAGRGPLKAALQHQAQQLGLSQAITWQDEVAYPQMPAVYHQAHLYLQTSRHESQGMAVLEAMACGRPAVGTPVGVMAEVGYGADWDPAGIARQAVALLTDETLYRPASHQARHIATHQFSLPATLATFQALYREVMSYE